MKHKGQNIQMKMIQKTKTNETSAIPNIMPKILPNDEITEGIYFLNSKQREVFDLVHTWAGLNIL